MPIASAAQTQHNTAQGTGWTWLCPILLQCSCWHTRQLAYYTGQSVSQSGLRLCRDVALTHSCLRLQHACVYVLACQLCCLCCLPALTWKGDVARYVRTAARMSSALLPGNNRRPAVALRDRPVLACTQQHNRRMASMLSLLIRLLHCAVLCCAALQSDMGYRHSKHPLHAALLCALSTIAVSEHFQAVWLVHSHKYPNHQGGQICRQPQPMPAPNSCYSYLLLLWHCFQSLFH